MGSYRILWSLRGRTVVEADSHEQAIEEFYQMAAEGRGLDDSDGYEIDEAIDGSGQPLSGAINRRWAGRVGMVRTIKMWCRTCDKVTKFSVGEVNTCQTCGKEYRG